MTLPLLSSLTLGIPQTPLSLDFLTCEIRVIALPNSWARFENSNRFPFAAPRTVANLCYGLSKGRLLSNQEVLPASIQWHNHAPLTDTLNWKKKDT